MVAIASDGHCCIFVKLTSSQCPVKSIYSIYHTPHCVVAHLWLLSVRSDICCNSLAVTSFSLYMGYNSLYIALTSVTLRFQCQSVKPCVLV